jgi:uncharacterized protein
MPTDSHQGTGTRETAAAFLSLLGAGDPDRIADIFASEIDWYVPGSPDLPWTGQRSTRAEVPAYFHALWPAFVPGESETEIHKVLIDGPDAVILGRFTHTMKSNGRRFTTPVALHLTVDNGHITRMHLFEDTYIVAKTAGVTGLSQLIRR